MLWTSGFRSRSVRSVSPSGAHAAPRVRWKTSTGPSPRTELDQAVARRRPRPRRRPSGPPPRASRPSRARRRAWPSACSRRRASPATSTRSIGISTCRAPSNRWSTAVSPWPPVTSAAGAPSSTSRSASSRRPAPSHARERLGLGQVRRHDGREREEPADERSTASSRSSVAPELATMTGSTTSGTGCSSRKSATVSIERPREEHPGLGGVDADVVEDGLELRRDEGRRQLVDVGDGRRVLGRERDERRHAVAAGRGERLQVGLDACSAARVGRRDRETPWNHVTPFAGMTRIRFDGCDLSPCGAPRCGGA